MSAFFEILGNLTTTSGRVSRSTFWWFHGLLFTLFLFYGFLLDSEVLPELFTSMAAFLIFALLLMRFIVEIKRWHDRDKSGWWVLIGLIP